MEFWWFNLPVLFLLGRLYGSVWQKAMVLGGPWIAQYIIIAALSLYLVMQTGEAVIFRSLLLSLPLRLTWYVARIKFASKQANFADDLAPPDRFGQAPEFYS
jgi:hypothetical protein